MSGDRQMIAMDRHDALAMVAGVAFGRVVFTDQALPAIRPVNHVIDDESVIIRTHLGSALSAVTGSSEVGVVAYEADDIDPDKRLGWSVVITGMAEAIEDEATVARYEEILRPWVSRPMDRVIRIVPKIVSGFWLAESRGA
ncbi:pyridoxamine 5'-phosphate oxidase family protein [Phytoactinopolyspora mesophila]|uniref:Pyridoxamine 5'-phosphate oxidase family protein n=1 Tax=Phytoactinopolyspora mesophila TaxID=2650750 RepID=A0A7K3M8N2_9ACTN|nr:pyridoxamine 5'-phosphate oxidase family protein [Phytoactinopolyspora mesophila]NDL59665.1 pyridoxamine 5'-phosphate oxidase family protein [Phytoactinopolyspora mesophila]